MSDQTSPLLSVLMPMYNHQDYVGEALASIRPSNAKEIQVVLCDDGSSDDTAKIAMQWVSKRFDDFHSIIFVQNKKNQGITKTLNQLVSLSNGEFITTIGSDDKFTRGAIDEKISAIKKNPNIDFFFTDSEIIDAAGLTIKERCLSPFRRVASRLKICIMLMCMFEWQIVWARPTSRRTQLLSLGGYREDDVIEDRWIAIKVMNQGNYKYLDRICYCYRYRGKHMHPSPEIGIDLARENFIRIERDLHPETTGLLNALLWIRRLPFRTNRGVWPTKGLSY